MPRSASKNQADKRRSKSSIQVTAPLVQDLEVNNIIHGHITQAQWTDMLIKEDADETVGEIMEELLSKVMEGCLKVYIERQIAPFSASWAESYFTQILEQQIVCLDEGEGPEEASKTEDTEPMPATSDAWAQGCVPVVNVVPKPQPASQQEIDIGRIPAQTEPTVNQQCNAVEQTNRSPKQSEKETSPWRPVLDKRYKIPSPRLSPQVDQKRKQQIILPPKPVPGKLLPPMSHSAEKKNVKIVNKRETHSVCNSTAGPSFHKKDYRHIPRLDPSRLPRHSVLPQYEILDNNHSKSNTKKLSGLSKLEQRYKKQQTEWTVTSLKPLTNSTDQPQMSPSRHTKQGISYSGPLRLDTMELAKGVSLLDPQTADNNSFKFNSPVWSTKLRTIQSETAVPLYSVEQVTAGPPPQVTPLIDK
uniref:uncharacterized protein C2orf81 homolog n=1 Tax=Scatophagus argus TaxID=75038 RepID=UPI001ED805B3|nr:uncharacterized protein C2orf81 homolog [Scatophagus argus]